MEDIAMWIIIDKKMPSQAKKKLRKYGNLIEIETSGITYNAISGHPDIFFCKSPVNLVVAPNLPGKYLKLLQKLNITFTIGKDQVGNNYPATAKYNACCADEVIIHNFSFTDLRLLEASSNLKAINVKQGYCRCNLIPLGKNKFITSDRGIFESLLKNSYQVLFVDPKNIFLEDFKHGFFGGCTGVYNNMFFVNGALSKYEDGDKVRAFLSEDFEIIELHEGQLIDVGSIIFIGN